MNLPESIAIGGLSISFIGSVLAILTFMRQMSRDVAEIKKQVTNDIQHIAEEEDKKRGRVYERLDSFKKLSEEKFVLKDMCSVLHMQQGRDIEEMKNDIKILIKRQP